MKLFRRDESGQVLAIFALALVALLGFAALAIDVSLMLHKRAELQKAADAAALAGIMDVWEKTSTHAVGEARAIDYAKTNGAEKAEADVLLKYEPYSAKEDLMGKPIFLQVKVESTVNHFFGPVIGMKSSLIQADAIAVKVATWEGESLPFVNLATPPVNEIEVIIWDKNTPGDKESIYQEDREYFAEPYPHFRVNLDQGVAMQSGKDASIKHELQTMYDYYGQDKPVYVLSLSPEAFKRESFKINQKGKIIDVDIETLKDLKTQDSILLSELVLLKCRWTYYGKDKEHSQGNNMVLKLDIIDILRLNEIPDSYDGVGKINSYLVK